MEFCLFGYVMKEYEQPKEITPPFWQTLAPFILARYTTPFWDK